MKFCPLVPGVFLASIVWSTAQVSVEVVLEQEQFLLDESLPVKVRIANRSGQTLKLGQEADWLTFTIESNDGHVVAPLAEVPVAGEQSVDSSMVASRRVDLMPYYDLSKPGRYTVKAMVKIKPWNDEIVSNKKSFEISRGTRIWEQEFGVPAASGAPEGRKYALLEATYVSRRTQDSGGRSEVPSSSQKQLMLYVRVTDLSEHKVFKVFPVGPSLSFSRPEARIDRSSKLHLLFQTGARSFLYHVISPEAEILVRQTHDYTNTRPVLRSGEDGNTFVLGGIRHPTPKDIPAPSPTVSTNDLQTPKP